LKEKEKDGDIMVKSRKTACGHLHEASSKTGCLSLLNDFVMAIDSTKHVKPWLMKQHALQPCVIGRRVFEEIPGVLTDEEGHTLLREFSTLTKIRVPL
jgi:hypothetical protein